MTSQTSSRSSVTFKQWLEVAMLAAIWIAMVSLMWIFHARGFFKVRQRCEGLSSRGTVSRPDA